MPIATPTYQSNGDVMDPAAWNAQVEAARAWLNGGVVEGDIDDSEVLRDHIVRPVLGGSPTYGMVGRVHRVRQQVLDRVSGQVRTVSQLSEVLAPLTFDRDLLQPYQVGAGVGDAGVWVTRIGRSLHLPEVAVVEVSAACSVRITQGDGWNPGAGERLRVGRLLLAYFDRQSPSSGWIKVTDSSFELEAVTGVPALVGRRAYCLGLLTLSPGDYDVALVFDRQNNAGADDYLQISLRCHTFCVDVMATVVQGA